MHKVGISHRDLSPANIMLDDEFNIKIIDFGLCSFREEEDSMGFLYDKYGTPHYRAPEQIIGRYKGLESDLFSLGILMFVMYTGSPPFSDAKKTDYIYKYFYGNRLNHFWNIFEKKRPPGFFTPAFKDLMSSMLAVDP